MDEAAWKELFGRAADGDRAAFSELCGPAFFAGARLAALVQLSPALRYRVDVEGAVQDAMERAWRDLATLRDPTRDGFRRWLRGVIAHRVQDAARGATRARRDASREVPAGEAGESRFGWAADADPLQQAANRELHGRIADVLDQLSESYRRVILLRVLERCPTREVAVQLGKTEENVTVTLHRALIRFREALRRGGVDTTLFRPLQ